MGFRRGLYPAFDVPGTIRHVCVAVSRVAAAAAGTACGESIALRNRHSRGSFKFLTVPCRGPDLARRVERRVAGMVLL